MPYTPCADLIRERIKQHEAALDTASSYEAPLLRVAGGTLKIVLKEIESIESKNVENMMEEMPEMTSILKRQEGYYQAAILDNLTLSPIGGRGVNIGEGNTPSEALKELKKKLSNNQ